MKERRFTLLSLTTLLFLSSCGPVDYSKSNLITPEDFFNQSENYYGVYYFSETCPMCEESLPYINEYLNRLSKIDYSTGTIENIYFIDAIATPIDRYVQENDFTAFYNSQIGVTDYTQVTQVGYPILYIVQNVNEVKTLVDVKIGKKQLTDYISSIWYL